MELYRPGFVFTVEHLAADGRVLSVQTIHNIMPTVGLNYMLFYSSKDKNGFTLTSWQADARSDNFIYGKC